MSKEPKMRTDFFELEVVVVVVVVEEEKENDDDGNKDVVLFSSSRFDSIFDSIWAS